MRKFLILSVASYAAMASAASAQVVLDGLADAAYGSATASVAFDATAPEGNFGSPTNETNGAAYSIYLTSDANYVYGLVLAATTPSVVGTNLYFDVNPAVGGSDIGFEITNDRAFRPGVEIGTYSPTLAGLDYFIRADNRAIEFRLANSLFTSPIAGLNYSAYPALPTIGSEIRLNLSQTFGYSVAGGQDFYGDARLGVVTLGGEAAVPEPATWAMMLAGFGLVGAAVRRRRPVAAFA